MKIFTSGPAPEAVTNSVYDKTRQLTNIRLCPTLTNIDLITLGKHTYEIEGRSTPFEIEIIDSVDDYVHLMKSIFDFDKIRNLLNGEKGKFPIMINALSGVMGPYVIRIFHEELNAKDSVTVKNCENLEDFGGHHPDPNLTYAHELVEDMEQGDYEFGAAFDGDGVSYLVLVFFQN
jgi:phosphoglucomutase